jgi:hypothetical protein
MALACYLWPALSLRYANSKLPVIGEWNVNVSYSNRHMAFTDHTYQFLTNGVCVEKYGFDELVGSPEQSAIVEKHAVTTYEYKHLGGQRYRLYSVKSLVDGKPDTTWAPRWHILDISIKEDRAVVYAVSVQKTALEREIEKAVQEVEELTGDKEKNRTTDAASQKEKVTWTKITSTSL